MRSYTIISGLTFVALAAGCDKDDAKGSEKDPRAGAKAEGKAAAAKPIGETPAAKKKTTCADWGAEGKGEFGDDCKLAGEGALTIEPTGKYEQNVFQEEVPVFKVTNNFDRDLEWGFVNVWYYDGAGNQLELKGQDGSTFKRFYQNGGILQIAAGETKELGFGLDKKYEPAGLAAIEAEITGWGTSTEPKMFFSSRKEVPNWDDRPKGGWK